MKHDNTFTLTCKDIVNIEYQPDSACVSSGQPFDVPPSISNNGSGQWTIIFKAGRKKTSKVADSFTSVAGGSQYTLVVNSSNKTPDELNFYFGLNVTVSLPSGGRLDNIIIYLGQGSEGLTNNWWLGSVNLINFNGKAVLLGTQSASETDPPQPSQIAWRATAKMSTSDCSLSALSPTVPTPIELLDVWGEGRIVDGTTVSGFNNSLNLNLEAKLISNGPQKDQPIPQQVPVFDFDFPYFPIPDGSVAFVTLMGAPIVPATAKEIVRVLNPKKGVVILYDPNPGDIAVWDDYKGDLIFKPDEKLEVPFSEITFPNPKVYGFPGIVDKIDDHDEL